MEFISIGGLLPGLSAEDIRSGISQPRNRKLAEIFHRLRLIESYGTGIRQIFSLYKDSPIQPQIQVTHNTFKLILPNMNAAEPLSQTTAPETVPTSTTVTPQMKIVLDYLAEYGAMTDEELQELLNVKKTRAYLIARRMNKEGFIEIEGRGTGKKYKLKEA